VNAIFHHFRHCEERLSGEKSQTTIAVVFEVDKRRSNLPALSSGASDLIGEGRLLRGIRPELMPKVGSKDELWCKGALCALAQKCCITRGFVVS
jgi:hypothetical protein